MTTWRQTLRNNGLPFTNADVVPLFLTFNSVVPLLSFEVAVRVDTRYDFHVDAVDGRLWREIIDLTLPAPNYTVDPGAITGAWARSELIPMRALRDSAVALIRDKALTLMEFVREAP